MTDWSELLLKNGKCCICEHPLKGSEHINMLNLDKYVEWKFPQWGNILAKDPKKQGGRAVAIACDDCINEDTGEIKAPVKFAVEIEKKNEDTISIKYHKLEDLKDSPKIELKDLRI